jgi:hypothetical protein
MVKVGGRAYRNAMGLVKRRKSPRKSPAKRRSPRKGKSPKRRSPKKVKSPKRRAGRLSTGQKIACRVVKAKKASPKRSPKKM